MAFLFLHSYASPKGTSWAPGSIENAVAGRLEGVSREEGPWEGFLGLEEPTAAFCGKGVGVDGGCHCALVEGVIEHVPSIWRWSLQK
jgi:hypothetical protein